MYSALGMFILPSSPPLLFFLPSLLPFPSPPLRLRRVVNPNPWWMAQTGSATTSSLLVNPSNLKTHPQKRGIISYNVVAHVHVIHDMYCIVHVHVNYTCMYMYTVITDSVCMYMYKVMHVDLCLATVKKKFLCTVHVWLWFSLLLLSPRNSVELVHRSDSHASSQDSFESPCTPAGGVPHSSVRDWLLR